MSKVYFFILLRCSEKIIKVEQYALGSVINVDQSKHPENRAVMRQARSSRKNATEKISKDSVPNSTSSLNLQPQVLAGSSRSPLAAVSLSSPSLQMTVPAGPHIVQNLIVPPQTPRANLQPVFPVSNQAPLLQPAVGQQQQALPQQSIQQLQRPTVNTAPRETVPGQLLQAGARQLIIQNSTANQQRPLTMPVHPGTHTMKSEASPRVQANNAQPMGQQSMETFNSENRNIITTQDDITYEQYQQQFQVNQNMINQPFVQRSGTQNNVAQPTQSTVQQSTIQNIQCVQQATQQSQQGMVYQNQMSFPNVRSHINNEMISQQINPQLSTTSNQQLGQQFQQPHIQQQQNIQGQVRPAQNLPGQQILTQQQHIAQQPLQTQHPGHMQQIHQPQHAAQQQQHTSQQQHPTVQHIGQQQQTGQIQLQGQQQLGQHQQSAQQHSVQQQQTTQHLGQHPVQQHLGQQQSGLQPHPQHLQQTMQQTQPGQPMFQKPPQHQQIQGHQPIQGQQQLSGQLHPGQQQQQHPGQQQQHPGQTQIPGQKLPGQAHPGMQQIHPGQQHISQQHPVHHQGGQQSHMGQHPGQQQQQSGQQHPGQHSGQQHSGQQHSGQQHSGQQRSRQQHPGQHSSIQHQGSQQPPPHAGQKRPHQRQPHPRHQYNPQQQGGPPMWNNGSRGPRGSNWGSSGRY